MKCRLEENSRIFDVLCALKNGYESGDFTELFPFLAPDCVMESQWVLKPNTGYDAVVDYFTRKGETLAKHNAFPDCGIVELIGNCNPIRKASVSVNGSGKKVASVGLMYTPGKLCLLMEQTLNGETNGVMVDVQVGADGMVQRIDLCMPEIFKYRDFRPFVELLPAQDDDENEDAIIRVSEHYYRELDLFLACAGAAFYEYDGLEIPIEHWCKALYYWKAFFEANAISIHELPPTVSPCSAHPSGQAAAVSLVRGCLFKPYFPVFPSAARHTGSHLPPSGARPQTAPFPIPFDTSA